MAIDFREIELTDDQKRRVAGLAEQTGRPWREVLDEQLAIAANDAAAEECGTYKDHYIRDPQKRLAYFRQWVARQTSHNPHFDDSRESIYFDRA
jgi:hypothetical protein